MLGKFVEDGFHAGLAHVFVVGLAVHRTLLWCLRVGFVLSVAEFVVSGEYRLAGGRVERCCFHDVRLLFVSSMRPRLMAVALSSRPPVKPSKRFYVRRESQRLQAFAGQRVEHLVDVVSAFQHAQLP